MRNNKVNKHPFKTHVDSYNTFLEKTSDQTFKFFFFWLTPCNAVQVCIVVYCVLSETLIQFINAVKLAFTTTL